MKKELRIPKATFFDEEREEFVYLNAQKIVLVHSLVSISKWESKYHKPYMSTEQKTVEETMDYVKMMTVTQNVRPEVYEYIKRDGQLISEIAEYIEDPATATWFAKSSSPPSREVITSEKIYYWMITSGIPMECQKWHLNRLLTLIRVCSEMNKPPKKMSKSELAARNRSLNAARRAKYGSKG